MKKFMLLFLIAANLCLANENFFSNPQTITDAEAIEMRENRTIDMTWGQNNVLHFFSNANEVYFEILLDTLPDFFDDPVQSQFIPCELNGSHYFFSYERKLDQSPLFNTPLRLEQENMANSSSYLIHERRIFDQCNPQIILEEDIIEIIRHHNILFYTGAGISVASGVPSMNQLNGLLGINPGKEFLLSIKKAIEDPQTFADGILQFHLSCFYSPSTEAHKALKELALFKNAQIITENFDCLHEFTGILPYRINAEQLREEVGADHLHAIDYIICVGLSYDDKGFLGWYKHNNPSGKIISIDLEYPSYLGVEDYIIHSDLQQLLPAIAERLINHAGYLGALEVASSYAMPSHVYALHSFLLPEISETCVILF